MHLKKIAVIEVGSRNCSECKGMTKHPCWVCSENQGITYNEAINKMAEAIYLTDPILNKKQEAVPLVVLESSMMLSMELFRDKLNKKAKAALDALCQKK